MPTTSSTRCFCWSSYSQFNRHDRQDRYPDNQSGMSCASGLAKWRSSFIRNLGFRVNSLYLVYCDLPMSAAPIPWKHVRNVLVLFAPLWVGTTVIFTVTGLGYAFFSESTWSARQPLVVRDEATGSVDRLGRFASQTELKAAQETILEMTQDPAVVARALQQIGAPQGVDAASWPTTSAVDSTIKSSVNLVAPKGSEFGNTEVVYLTVKAGGQQRASDFCSAMFDNLTQHLRNVRRVRADSIISELYFARDLARKNLDEATNRLQHIEVKFGADLSELRNLNESISGDGATRRALEVSKTELQAAQVALSQQQSLHEMLVKGVNNPKEMLISGSDLLTSQPSLLRLKNGLIDAQIQSSELAGRYTEHNPKRRAAEAAETEILNRMQREIRSVVRGMQPRITLTEQRIAKLTSKKEALQERLDKLADARADYSIIHSEVKQRTELVADAERLLAEAQASRSASLSTNFVEQLGPPQVTDGPIGPSGSLLAAGSAMAGLIFGLGTVFLIAPGPTESHGRRRWSDYLSGQGRRQSDSETKESRSESPRDPIEASRQRL